MTTIESAAREIFALSRSDPNLTPIDIMNRSPRIAYQLRGEQLAAALRRSAAAHRRRAASKARGDSMTAASEAERPATTKGGGQFFTAFRRYDRPQYPPQN